jgi:predicted DNA-binding protein
MLQSFSRTTYDRSSYYTGDMASVRLEPDLEARLEQAAAVRGESKSDFIRAAVTERIVATLGTSLVDRLAHVIGQAELGGGSAERAHELAREGMAAKLRAEMEAWPRRR